MSANTWEEAVEWFRATATAQEVRDNYFDLPATAALERFGAGEEFAATRRHLPLVRGGRLLDLGAGNGISSGAFAQAGWQVTAVEPDPSAVVGCEAIRRLAEARGLAIDVRQTVGEDLPVEDASVDAVYGRQVLHHVRDLDRTMSEVTRVLRPGGRAMFVREHVAENDAELQAFLAAHPLHGRYGGENAMPLATYRSAATGAGLSELAVIAPLASPINFFPTDGRTRARQLARGAVELARGVTRGRWLGFGEVHRASNIPGRLYSFVWQKETV